MSAHLNFDMWCEIATYLDGESLVRLASCSKELQALIPHCYQRVYMYSSDVEEAQKLVQKGAKCFLSTRADHDVFSCMYECDWAQHVVKLSLTLDDEQGLPRALPSCQVLKVSFGSRWPNHFHFRDLSKPTRDLSSLPTWTNLRHVTLESLTCLELDMRCMMGLQLRSLAILDDGQECNRTPRLTGIRETLVPMRSLRRLAIRLPKLQQSMEWLSDMDLQELVSVTAASEFPVMRGLDVAAGTPAFMRRQHRARLAILYGIGDDVDVYTWLHYGQYIAIVGSPANVRIHARSVEDFEAWCAEHRVVVATRTCTHNPFGRDTRKLQVTVRVDKATHTVPFVDRRRRRLYHEWDGYDSWCENLPHVPSDDESDVDDRTDNRAVHLHAYTHSCDVRRVPYIKTLTSLTRWSGTAFDTWHMGGQLRRAAAGAVSGLKSTFLTHIDDTGPDMFTDSDNEEDEDDKEDSVDSEEDGSVDEEHISTEDEIMDRLCRLRRSTRGK